MNDEILRELIEKYIIEKKLKSPQFSYRALSKKIGISSGALSLFLNSKRTLSPEGYDKVINYLILDPEERKNALAAINKSFLDRLRLSDDGKPFRELRVDEFSEMKEWYVFAFLCLIQTANFEFDLFWISHRLRVSPDKIEALIELCFRLRLIKIDETNRLTRTHENLRTPDNLKDKNFEESINYYHNQLIAQSQVAVSEIPRSLRDVTAVTMPANPQKLEKVRELVRKFQDDVMLLVEDGSESEVYRLCVQFYPVTRPD